MKTPKDKVVGGAIMGKCKLKKKTNLWVGIN